MRMIPAISGNRPAAGPRNFAAARPPPIRASAVRFQARKVRSFAIGNRESGCSTRRLGVGVLAIDDGINDRRYRSDPPGQLGPELVALSQFGGVDVAELRLAAVFPDHDLQR